MIRLIKPDIKYSDIEEDFKVIFESGIFTKGSYVNRFAKAMCDYTGAAYCSFATSATTALSMCLKVLGIKLGDKVLVSDFSFPASVNVIEDLYAHPIFVDVDINTFNMRPDDLEKKITKDTKAVIFVDLAGNPSGIHEIKSIVGKHGIPLIEDAACAIGSSENNIKCGNIADLTCFSFHPRKLLTTGEGGAILTNNNEYKKILDVKLAHGAVIINEKLDFIDYGYNYRLPELQAAMGIKQLMKLDEVISIRQKIAGCYADELRKFGFVEQKIAKNVIHNIQSVVFRVPSDIKRDELVKYLKEKDVETTIGTYCLSDCTYYREKYNNIQPIAKQLFDTTITLPCFTGVNIEIVIDNIKNFFERG